MSIIDPNKFKILSTEEQNLIASLDKAHHRLNELRLNIKYLKEQVTDQETESIGAQLEIQNLTEQLRRLRLRTVRD